MKRFQGEEELMLVDDRASSKLCCWGFGRKRKKASKREKSPNKHRVMYQELVIEKWPSVISLGSALSVQLMDVQIRQLPDPQSLIGLNVFLGIIGPPIIEYKPSCTHLTLALDTKGIKPKNLRPYYVQRIIVFDFQLILDEASILFLPQTFCIMFHNERDAVKFLTHWENLIKDSYQEEPIEDVLHRLSVRISVEREIWVEVNLQQTKQTVLKSYCWEKIGLSWERNEEVIRKIVKDQTLKNLSSLVKIKKQGEYDMLNLTQKLYQQPNAPRLQRQVEWDRELKAHDFPLLQNQPSSSQQVSIVGSLVEEEIIIQPQPSQLKKRTKSLGTETQKQIKEQIEQVDIDSFQLQKKEEE